MAPFSKGFLIQLIISAITLGAFASTNNCPMTCFCDQKPVGEETIPGGYGLKVHCLPSVESGKSSSFNIQLPSNTIHLDLANYGIKEIEAETFLGLLHLQKLDLQGNEINSIDGGAFASLPKLQNLDLSRNQLEKVEKGTFSGLVSLRRLKLNGNNLTTLEEDSFLPLKALEKVDLSDNPIVCDCKIAWLVEWSQVHSKIQNSAKTKCAMPIEKANVPIFKFAKSELECNNIIISHSEVFLSPSNDQVVFQGDEMSFHCRTNSFGQQWVLNGRPLEHNGKDLIVTQVGSSSVLRISSLETTFQGQLDCVATDRSKASINILVLPRKTPVCNPITLSTSRGIYYFQASVAGLSVYQPCQKHSYGGQDGAAIASLQCRQTGEWAASVNVSKCAYTSDFTDTLHKFASMNTSFTPNTLVESASHFLNYTAHAKSFQNPMDVVFFSQAVENYLPYLKRYNDVGHFMMDMVGNMLQVNSALLNAAQKDGLACSRLLNVMENITRIAVPAFRHHAANIAMESFTIKPSQRFDGISCSWYESSFTMYRYSTRRRDFHCAQSNKTLDNPDKKLIISLVVPPSLYNHIDYQLLSTAAYGSSSSLVQLMFAVFANSSLFPDHQTPQKEVPVIGGKLLGSSQRKLNLTEPVVISVRTFSARRWIPVVWDHYANGGHGAWTSRPCYTIGHNDGVLRFACVKLGYYSLLHDTTHPPTDKMTAESKWHHPVLYFGTGIASVLITLNWIVFIWRWPVIEIATELKHSLVNVWFCVLVSLYLFTMGIYQSNLYCQLVAITLHYFTIACFNWLFVGVYIIYTKVSKKNSEQQPLSENVDVLLVKPNNRTRSHLVDSTKSCNSPEGGGGKPGGKPLIRFYIFAYFLALFIVAITASSSAQNYSQTGFCFITTTTLAPLVGGFFVPLAFISTVMIGFGLSIICVLATSPYKVKERQRSCEKLESHVLALDNLQSPRQVLLWHAITFFFVCLALTSAGFLCYERTDDESPIVVALISTLFSFAIVSFAIFNFVHFCLCRGDIFILSCLKRFTSSVQRSDQNQVDSPENEELVTENFVELCARPLPPLANQAHPDYANAGIASVAKESLTGGFTLDQQLQQPKTSSPVHSHIPLVQDITVSPLTVVNVLTGDPASEAAYSVVPLPYKPKVEISLASVNTGISYTDSSTIRMGAPCDMATFDAAAPPPPSSASLIGTDTPRRLLGPHHLNVASSSSLPRSLRHNGKLLRKPATTHVMMPDEDLLAETQSKFSIGSSTRSGHSKASGSRRSRHKKPNRRRSRQQLKPSKDKEPVYNNLKENEDNEYLGDDDQFDTLDRLHKKNAAAADDYPSVIHEAEGDEEEMMILDEDNDSLSQGREEPASLEDLAPNLADLSKRETSV